MNLRRIFFPNLRIFRPKLRRLLRKFTTLTSVYRNVSTSWIQNNPVSTGFPNLFDEGPATMVPFPPNKTVDIRLNDGHNDLRRCKSQECLEPSQYDRDGRCYLALRYVDPTNDECTTQPNPLEAFKWTKSLAFSG